MSTIEQDRKDAAEDNDLVLKILAILSSAKVSVSRSAYILQTVERETRNHSVVTY